MFYCCKEIPHQGNSYKKAFNWDLDYYFNELVHVQVGRKQTGTVPELSLNVLYPDPQAADTEK